MALVVGSLLHCYCLLQEAGCRLGRMLEVLDEVAIATVPAFFLTHHTYKLYP